MTYIKFNEFYFVYYLNNEIKLYSMFLWQLEMQNVNMQL